MFLPNRRNNPSQHPRDLPLLRFAMAAMFAFSAMGSHASGAVLIEGSGVSINAQDVQAEMQRMPEPVRERFLSEPDQLRELVQTLHLRKVLAAQAQTSGLAQSPETAYKLGTARESILAEAYVDRIAESATPAPAAIDKRIQSIYKAEPERFRTPAETHARHILIKGKDADARAQAEKLLQELRNGADFEALAREHSADPGSAAKGGDLGFFPKGKMVPAFDAALDALDKPGSLSPVVESEFGLHIIRLEARKPGTLRSFDEVKEQLRAETVAKLQQDARKKEVERVRNEAKGDASAMDAFIAEQKRLAPAPAAQAK
jgi:peptidyl-prolyl cis-trans isomerase C